MTNEKENESCDLTEDQAGCWTEDELAVFFNTTTSTIRRRRLNGTGPPFFDLQNGKGKRVIPRYRKDLAIKWTEQNPIVEED